MASSMWVREVAAWIIQYRWRGKRDVRWRFALLRFVRGRFVYQMMGISHGGAFVADGGEIECSAGGV